MKLRNGKRRSINEPEIGERRETSELPNAGTAR